MQLQCSSVSGAFRQYSLQYFVPGGTVQEQLGCAHFCGTCGSGLGSAMGVPRFHAHYAPVPVLRRLGFRTTYEIDRERYALKALRGDFDGVAQARDKAGAALQAVRF